MNFLAYFILYFTLFTKSRGVFENGNFKRLTTNGTVRSVFLDFTTKSKMKCVTGCQETERCLTFSRKAESNVWRCQYSDKQDYLTGTDGAAVYIHLNRGCIPTTHEYDTGETPPLTPTVIVNKYATVSHSPIVYTFPLTQPRRTSAFLDVRCGSNLNIKFMFRNEHQGTQKTLLNMLFSPKWKNEENLYKNFTSNSWVNLPQQSIIGKTFMKPIWVSLNDNGYISLGTGQDLYENVVLNVSEPAWSPGDYLEMLRIDSSGKGDDLDVTIYSTQAITNLTSKTAVFPPNNIDFNKAFDSDVTTEIEINNYNEESIISIDTRELQQASYVNLYTDWKNCSLTCDLEIYSSENVNGTTNSGYCYHLSSYLYDVTSYRCTYMCICPTSGCQYTIIKYKAPISIATREIEVC